MSDTNTSVLVIKPVSPETSQLNCFLGARGNLITVSLTADQKGAIEVRDAVTGAIIGSEPHAADNIAQVYNVLLDRTLKLGDRVIVRVHGSAANPDIGEVWAIDNPTDSPVEPSMPLKVEATVNNTISIKCGNVAVAHPVLPYFRNGIFVGPSGICRGTSF